MKVLTVREALNLAKERGVRLEAVTPRALKEKASAVCHVPPGGLLVKDDNGFTALACVSHRLRIKEDGDA